MNNEKRKSMFKVFWLVKGHLNTSEQDIIDCYNSYFNRVWYNEEAYIYEEGFEEAYEKFYNNIK